MAEPMKRGENWGEVISLEDPPCEDGNLAASALIVRPRRSRHAHPSRRR